MPLPLASSSPEEAWQQLLRDSTMLPKAIDDFENNLMLPVQRLTDSNLQLLLSNEQLVTSLLQSKVELAISERLRAESQVQLHTSINTITQVQTDMTDIKRAVKKLELENVVLKVGVGVTIVIALIEGGYILLHK